jgi:hypothetical protein
MGVRSACVLRVFRFELDLKLNCVNYLMNLQEQAQPTLAW